MSPVLYPIMSEPGIDDGPLRPDDDDDASRQSVGGRKAPQESRQYGQVAGNAQTSVVRSGIQDLARVVP